jgi:hypothetical protein
MEYGEINPIKIWHVRVVEQFWYFRLPLFISKTLRFMERFYKVQSIFRSFLQLLLETIFPRINTY